MSSHKQDFACGVTTGDLLCAFVGSKVRSEYTVFGDAINLSARLMCKAKAGLGVVLCDERTREHAALKAHYKPLELLKLKGKEKTVQVWFPPSLSGCCAPGERSRGLPAAAPRGPASC